MTSPALPDTSGMPVPDPPVSPHPFDGPRLGSSLTGGVREMIVCTRHGNPPLRFKGRLLTHHWMRMERDTILQVRLWQQNKTQLVLGYSIVANGQIGSDARQVPDVAAASDHLEAVCAAFAPSDLEAREVPWADVHFHLCFGQHFAVLVADVLNDWQSLPTVQEQV